MLSARRKVRTGLTLLGLTPEHKSWGCSLVDDAAVQAGVSIDRVSDLLQHPSHIKAD